ncbi:MAG: hypothetical protein ACLRFO_04485 [Alphaproteobacteria bacterium]
MKKIAPLEFDKETKRQNIKSLVQYLRQHMDYIQVVPDVLPQYNWVTKKLREEHRRSSSGKKLVVPGTAVYGWDTVSPNHIEITKCVKLGNSPRTGDDVRLGEQFFHIALYSPGIMYPFYIAELGKNADLYKQIDQVHQSVVDCEIRANSTGLCDQLLDNNVHKRFTLYNVPNFVAQKLAAIYGKQK